jgi:hypothetical protein
MGEPTTPTTPQQPPAGARGVYLDVDDIERLVRSFGENVVRQDPSARLRTGSCGVIVCGNGASLA